MHITHTPHWNLTPKEAILLQRQIRDQVKTAGTVRPVHLVAGADAAYDKRSNTTIAGIVVLRMPDLQIVETRVVTLPTVFPYIPGLLSFREGPALVRAFEAVQSEPDVVFIDGHGLSHPRSAGIATHMGVILDLPTIGCAKSLLTGSFEQPAPTRGSVAYLYDQSRHIIGAVVRTRDRVKPVFVSIGHRIDLNEAIRLTLACGKGYRIPEPTRQADRLVAKAKQEIA